MSFQENNIGRLQGERQLSPEKILPTSVDVIIVGAGLSGKAIAPRLGADISFVIIDSRKASKSKEAMYLITSSIAERWGISENERTKRNLVTNCVWYAPSGEVAEELRTTGEKEGFAIIPQTAMERALHVDPGKIFYETKFLEVDDPNEGKMTVHTDQGNIEGNLVIDTTGWEANVIHQHYGNEDYMIDAVYGGNYRTRGFNPNTMSFIRGLPLNNKNWVMPTGKQGAEVVATQQTQRSKADEWWDNYAETQFNEMVDVYNAKGQTIINNKAGKRMGFRLEPAKRKFYKDRVVPFGESAGLNSPLIGQLVDVLPLYAQRMADIINDTKTHGSWDHVGKRFYRSFITDAPYSYLLHSVMRDNSIKLQDGYPIINRKLTDALKTVFSEEKLWSTLRDNGLSTKDLATLAKAHPLQLAEFAIESVPSLLSILVHNPELYVQFIAGLSKNTFRRGKSVTDIYNA